MTPEVWTAVGSMVSAVVIAATAVAALIQLRHLRAGNAINAMLTLRSSFSDPQFTHAAEVISGDALAVALQDSRFREFALRRGREPFDGAAELLRSFLLVGNWYEVLGSLVRQNIVTMASVGDNYANVVDSSWNLCEPLIAYVRAARGDQSVLEGFEYLTLLSRKWMHDHPSTFPRGVERMNLVNRYPI